MNGQVIAERKLAVLGNNCGYIVYFFLRLEHISLCRDVSVAVFRLVYHGVFADIFGNDSSVFQFNRYAVARSVTVYDLDGDVARSRIIVDSRGGRNRVFPSRFRDGHLLVIGVHRYFRRGFVAYRSLREIKPENVGNHYVGGLRIVTARRNRKFRPAARKTFPERFVIFRVVEIRYRNASRFKDTFVLVVREVERHKRRNDRHFVLVVHSRERHGDSRSPLVVYVRSFVCRTVGLDSRKFLTVARRFYVRKRVRPRPFRQGYSV